ncbi:ATP/DNA-binding protein [Medicago truncatula]|uniref:ATP/DNA-binding protein n=2 Tax=Medicago truncatula TaxID=3880 RepID=G7LDJ1_MEDTR|nr:ATP/DNA-binding protein [Medicago truncatula]
MATQKKHIEEIRRKKFSIGGNPNPLTEDLHQAVKNLSDELYTRDVHFLMELIQNAEDNHYIEGVSPTLEFIITSKDITATGAPATLLIFNNEKGFSRQNIESICSVGRSTKKGNRSSGYIGEKGIGFKSVFLVTAQPYIFSNGYQIRFSERPCTHCSLGYIVPEWVEEKPSLLDIKQIYGAGKDSLPTTIIVLPLKLDKVEPVKQQLSSVNPEVLLFLLKIRHLSVREDNEDPKKNTVTSVSISSEIDFVTRKNMDAESYTINLSAGEKSSDEKKCCYYMWKQKFPVKLQNVVERRKDVEECVVTLAFPRQERLQKIKKLRKHQSSPGVYAFLPTEMVTNFPFIIQADFVLASSRETILLNDKWNQGILEYVPSAFVDAFKTLVTESNELTVSSLPDWFKFLPIDSSPIENFNYAREKIKEKLAEEKIVPIETFTEQKQFYKPSEVSRLLPKFWNILTMARVEGVHLLHLSSHDGMKILSSSFDKSKYEAILKFLGVKHVKFEWYAKCIQSTNLVDGVSENLYLELLLFLAKNWKKFKNSNIINNIPLIKYVASDEIPSFLTIKECKQNEAGAKRVMLADLSRTSWLINWNKTFRCAANQFFMPESTQQAISQLNFKKALVDWLVNDVNVHTLNGYIFAKDLSSSIKNNRKLAVAYAHFLYHSLSEGYLSCQEVDDLCSSMPLVDKNGRITKSRNGVLLPENVSKWADLMVSNPWRKENYVELGKMYLNASYADQSTDSGKLIEFLKNHVGASDIPYLSPPNAGFSAADTQLTKENAFLLLDWIRELKHKGVHLPERFLACIKEGSWLKVTGNGFMSPSKSFLIGSLGNILQSGSVLVDIPLIDESFYGERINEYKEELKTIGVMFNCEEACEFIGKELMSRAASFSLSRSHVLLILNFVQYIRTNLLPLDNFVDSIKEASWLKTSCGLRPPVGSVLNDSGWQVASQISDIPFIDRAYFGEQIYNYKEELKLLGVIVDLTGNYQVVIEHLKSPSNLASLTAEAVLLIMECIRHLNAPDKLLNSLSGTGCLKTNTGFKTPAECFLYDPVWGCILEVFIDLPVIDHNFYGAKIFSYKDELRQIGVVVDYGNAIKKFSSLFERKALETSINQKHVISFLKCCRQLEGSFPSDFSALMRKMKWLHTSVGGFRCPKNCILYSPEWESISSITRLPFIDYSDKCGGYKAELKSIGVVTELKDGLRFVAECLNFPSNPSTISPESVFSLLECIQLLIQDNNLAFEDDFRGRLSQNWLKTHAGYRSPEKCLLFGSKWSSLLNPTDGPFIDENFYGPNIAFFQKELNAIGVISEVEKGCSLLASHLDTLSDHDTIVKIYKFLYQYNWKAEENAAKKVWILDGIKGGKFVDSKECVLHDPAKLFGSKFYVLEDIYDEDILLFFLYAMDIKSKPYVEDYVDLWNDWGSSMEQLSYDECCKFWTSISKHLSTNQEKKLAESLMKLPTSSGNNEIFLVDKKDAFIPDNLHMKKLFEREKVFVWYPQHSMKTFSKSELSDIYRKIGVRNISESLCKEESASVNDSDKLNYVDPNNIFNLKGLVKLILGFLACAFPKMEPKKRHEAVQSLINSSFHETTEPINVSYSLSLSSGEIITKKANKRVRWESQSCKFIIQKMEEVPGDALRCATSFSEAISEGILRENHDHVAALSELITLGFVLKFKNEEIDFLMESKNLQIDLEDEEFLSSAFPFD